ncbi:Transcriptional regulatory protein YycF [Enhygromyxa salina]|uniref:Transcriptional regulatory protein YycF n=1 Tax=Enhygromyxa salina TaxID=215803 RepID=A0A2S9XXY6_9BACT|nr:response regulator [Enhygromyxa salina]PRP97704.1 Transcriptional regulatory protein YycF [Enhygromyxa salina]
MTASAQSKGASLLVVDDNEDNLDMLSRRLRRRGYEVEAARSGIEALDAIDARRFDVILLDVMMPGVNGLEVLQKVRQRFSKTQLPVLMATARGDSEDVVEALQLGANDYVVKPLDLAELVAALEVALGHSTGAERSIP